jgi:hypothetical protein
VAVVCARRESTLLSIIRDFCPDAGFHPGDENGEGSFDYALRKLELESSVKMLRLPQFPLDELIRELGGPDAVAEITGRKIRLDLDQDGTHRG